MDSNLSAEDTLYPPENRFPKALEHFESIVAIKSFIQVLPCICVDRRMKETCVPPSIVCSRFIFFCAFSWKQTSSAGRTVPAYEALISHPISAMKTRYICPVLKKERKKERV